MARNRFCQQCGEVMQGKGMQYYVYCSRECIEQAKEAGYAGRVCPVCGKPFSAFKKHNRKYCSASCGAAAQREKGLQREKYYRVQDKWKVNPTKEQLEGRSCLCCGAAITQMTDRPLTMFCGDNCGRKFRYYTSPEQRAALRQQLYETQRPAQAQGKQPCMQTYICKRCGEAFEDYKYKKRIYCSRDCNNKSHRYADSENLAVTEEIRLLPSSATQRAAKEMRAAGKTNTEIADALGCNLSTVQGWLRNTRRKTTPAQHRPFSEPFYRYIHARSAVEWRAVLQDEMRCNPAYAGLEFPQDRAVTLVCGTVFSRTKLYALAALAESLGLDPLNGNTYAFCSPEREWLIFLRWDGSGFQLTKRQRDYGRYVWPGEKLGKSIAVTALEFEFILFGSQKKEKLENP